jgi:hypothetical protein
MKGRIGKKAKLPAVAKEIVDRTEGRPDVATALRLAGGDCSPASRPPDVGFARKNGDAIRDELERVRPRGKSNFANAMTLAAGDLHESGGLTTILIIVGGRDTCSGPRSESIIRDALDDLRNQPGVKVNFKFVGVNVPRQVRRLLERAKRHARRLHFVAVTDYANHAADLPDIVKPPTPSPTGTPSPADTSEATP